MNKSAIDIDKIFKCYYRPLCLYALHYVHNTDISEDIVKKEALEQIQKKFDTKAIVGITLTNFMYQ